MIPRSQGVGLGMSQCHHADVISAHAHRLNTWCQAIMRDTRWHVMPHGTALLIDVLRVVGTKTFFRSASESTEPEKDGMLILDNFP